MSCLKKGLEELHVPASGALQPSGRAREYTQPFQAQSETYGDGLELIWFPQIPAPRLLSSMPDPSSIVSRRSPVQGEDTREILAELGFSAAAVEDLIEKGAVKCTATRSKL